MLTSTIVSDEDRSKGIPYETTKLSQFGCEIPGHLWPIVSPFHPLTPFSHRFDEYVADSSFDAGSV